MNNLIGTGIIATLIIAFWQKVKGVLWYFVSFFIDECDKTREITISSSSNGFEIKENNYGIYFELS